MRIRVTKTPPAHFIDGFDVRGLCAEQTYDLEARMANYLILARFAIPAEDDQPNSRPQGDGAEPTS